MSGSTLWVLKGNFHVGFDEVMANVHLTCDMLPWNSLLYSSITFCLFVSFFLCFEFFFSNLLWLGWFPEHIYFYFSTVGDIQLRHKSIQLTSKVSHVIVFISATRTKFHVSLQKYHFNINMLNMLFSYGTGLLAMCWAHVLVVKVIRWIWNKMKHVCFSRNLWLMDSMIRKRFMYTHIHR